MWLVKVVYSVPNYLGRTPFGPIFKMAANKTSRKRDLMVAPPPGNTSAGCPWSPLAWCLTLTLTMLKNPSCGA